MIALSKSTFSLKEVRCKSCNKLLAKASEASIEIKCPRCKTINQRTLN